MRQKAIVKRLISDCVAEISLMRQLECGLSCKSCEGCPQKPTDELLAAADNSRIHARPGDQVEVVSNFAGVYLAVFYAFVLPCVGLLAFYLLGAAAGLGQLICVLLSFGGAVVFFVPALLFNRRKNRGRQIEFTIVDVLR